MQRAEQRQQNVKMEAVHEQPQSLVGGNAPEAVAPAKPEPVRNAPFNKNDPNTWGRVSRNDPCPCGSGKKYKHCHGRID